MYSDAVGVDSDSDAVVVDSDSDAVVVDSDSDAVGVDSDSDAVGGDSDIDLFYILSLALNILVAQVDACTLIHTQTHASQTTTELCE